MKILHRTYGLNIAEEGAQEGAHYGKMPKI
jgi:hypothetical protein